MSLLEQSKQFKQKIASQPVLARPQIRQEPVSLPPTRVSTPTINGEASPKKRPKTTIVYSQPADSGVGTHLLSQLHYAVDYLKRFEVPKTPEELEGYLSVPLTPTLAHLLRKNERVHYDSFNDTYIFKPVYNIRSAPALLAYLQHQKVATGLLVKDLKEGWSAAIEELGKLEVSGSVILLRQKKDNAPKTVWASSSDISISIDPEFADIWEKITVPGPADLPKEMEKVGLKPTSVDPSTIVRKPAASDGKGQKKSKSRRMKVSNTHLNTLKDFSGHRK